ncbi:MAG: nucleotide exchange factor GrpE [Alphaproteobacteria bacterium]|nr:nucleotide exchange factor GrpE [Alphaproteobacteria bacterium]
MTSETETLVPETAQETAQATENTAETEKDGAEDALEQAQTEIGKLKDQILRAMAETENTRRRMKKEVEDAQKFALGSFAKEMLVVADNFRRALDAVPKDGADGDTLKNLVTGVEATERQLLAAFERFGIKKISPLGEVFDPHYHQVMMEIDDPSKPAGQIVQVLQEGYMIHDRLLREAMVAVAKGGPTAHKVDTQA